MSETITVTLPGTPQTKGRPRFTRNGRTYTDARTAAAEQSVLAAWLTQAGRRPPHTGPVTVELHATFTPAASWPKWKRIRAALSQWPHLVKPDLDNLIKVLDGLNGHAWLDDSQITHIAAHKKYGSSPSTVLHITFFPQPTPQGDLS